MHYPYSIVCADRVIIPVRRAFFYEGLHAFERSFLHHVASHCLTRFFLRGCDTEFRLAVEEFFSHCDCDAWFAEDRGDEFLELRIEFFGFRDPVDQATSFCLRALMNSPVTSISNAGLRKIFRESATPGVDKTDRRLLRLRRTGHCSTRPRDRTSRPMTTCCCRDPLNACNHRHRPSAAC